MTSIDRTRQEMTDWMRARIARELECQPDEIDIELPFDQLGLDSLAILISTGELAEWLGVELEAATLFQHSTISALAEHLAQVGRPSSGPDPSDLS